MTYQMLADTILGIDLMDLIAHLVNFLVLIIAVGFLVYKPMINLIHTRQASVQAQIDENNNAKKEAEETKAQYESLLSTSEQEIAKNKVEAMKEADEKKEEILSSARKEAAQILEKAGEEAKEEKAQAISDMKGDIVSIATAIASGILSKEISAEEDEKLIDDCLKEWSERA